MSVSLGIPKSADAPVPKMMTARGKCYLTSTISSVELRAVQKPSDEEDSMVALVYSNGEILDGLNAGGAKVAAGTAWLWASEERI
jgi:hypothetical protein